MFYLPEKTPLGKLEVKDIFEFYDIPRLFTCKNKTGQYYLVLSIDENEEELMWLYLSISVDRLNLLLNHKKDLYFAFKNPEEEYLYKIKTYYLQKDAEFTYILPEQFTDDELPYENTYLTNEPLKYDYGLGAIDPVISAHASNREVFNLHFYPPNNFNHELGIREFGKTLIIFQDLVDAVGQKCSGKPTEKGLIPAEIQQKTYLNASQIFMGSFGFQMKSNYLDNEIFDYSLISDSLAEVFNLFTLKDNETDLKNKLHDLKGRAASKYQQLLKELLSIQSDLKIEWGSPKVNRGGEFFLEKKVIKQAFEIISKLDIAEREIIQIRGRLVAFDTITKSYKIVSLDDNRHFSGKVAEKAEIPLPNFQDIYSAEIEQIIKTQSSSGKEEVKYELIKLIAC